ncbi:hypothetical protein K439DRAFT_1350268 [Ramaria rubella]|nr:hypothetical protein K439DRAFT_1350268 [Ramaria rubella]
MLIPLPRTPSPVPVDLSSVTMQAGPPSRGELAKFYPARYTWPQLKSFMASGDLGLLKRDPVLQKRYNAWSEDIKKEHGSITNYLVNVRLGWGPRTPLTTTASPSSSIPSLALTPDNLPQIVPDSVRKPEYFTSTPSPEDVKIIFNDWPYSIPPDISHYVIWSRLPIIHPAVVHPSVANQINQDGLWGFTGVGAKESAEGIYTDVAPGTLLEAREHILTAAHHTHQFVLAHWPENIWEVAWFVNPPRIQSVKDLSHIHVFARRK